MNNREEILARVRREIKARHPAPDTRVDAITYPDRTARFTETLRAAGGDVVVLPEGDDVNRTLSRLLAPSLVIASNLPGITVATLDPDTLADPRDLNGTDVAIVAGEIGVAENGTVWIPQDARHRALYFIPEHLVILLSRDRLVDTMHDAYRLARVPASGFGTFISGPSKTADIEQSLVTGAHGPKALTVILL